MVLDKGSDTYKVIFTMLAVAVVTQQLLSRVLLK